MVVAQLDSHSGQASQGVAVAETPFRRMPWLAASGNGVTAKYRIHVQTWRGVSDFITRTPPAHREDARSVLSRPPMRLSALPARRSPTCLRATHRLRGS
jgi:hypothetical protein